MYVQIVKLIDKLIELYEYTTFEFWSENDDFEGPASFFAPMWAEKRMVAQ